MSINTTKITGKYYSCFVDTDICCLPVRLYAVSTKMYPIHENIYSQIFVLIDKGRSVMYVYMRCNHSGHGMLAELT